MIGETDNAYGRRKRCEAFNEEIQKLKEANKGEFPVEMELKNGFGHGGLYRQLLGPVRAALGDVGVQHGGSPEARG